LIPDRPYAQSRLEELYEDDPEGFPEAFGGGDAVFGFTEPSIKQQLRCRRPRLDQGDAVFTVTPAVVMPSMSGRTDEGEQALGLMRCQVPCWAIAEVFGRDPMEGDRLEPGVGRFSLVGSPMQRADRLTPDGVADEQAERVERPAGLDRPYSRAGE
jgi:hypothetical protein